MVSKSLVFDNKCIFANLGTPKYSKTDLQIEFGGISIPNRIKKSRPTHWKAQNDPKTSKLNRNRPENFLGSAAEAEPIEFCISRLNVLTCSQSKDTPFVEKYSLPDPDLRFSKISKLKSSFDALDTLYITCHLIGPFFVILTSN